MYLFSATTCAFYPLSMRADYLAAGTWPEEGIEVGASVFECYTGQPPEGKQRGSTPEGQPCWCDIPPLSASQQQASAERKKSRLMTNAGKIMSPLQDAEDLGIATAEESAQLRAWKVYRVKLNRIDPQGMSNIDWPHTPEA
ncbi:tail fiber assembly protein [Serratia fonticola]|uniref:tail fiber assembly protein n=1 Tax=Serratia fonticola TaxID=47917 RepID=UPI000464E11D|nr:tail fiber assembly protein [Serratia fonticola]